MTARLATHPDVADRTAQVLERLAAADVDVEYVGVLGSQEKSFHELRDQTIDLALVGIGALRGSVGEALTTVAVLPRLETRDVLVSLQGRSTPLFDLPAGARVGFVGARRAALLAAHRPDVVGVPLEVELLRAVARGPVAEVAGDAGSDALLPLDAVVMSALDARHEGLVDTTVEALEPKSWLPEPGQGALALVARHPIAEATALDHLPTRTALRTELALLDALGAAPDSTLGCLAQPSGRWIRLWAAAVSADGSRLVRSDLTGPLDEPEGLGASVARELESRGYALVAAETHG